LTDRHNQRCLRLRPLRQREEIGNMFPQVRAWQAVLLAALGSMPRAVAEVAEQPGEEPRWELTAADCAYFVQAHQRDVSGREGQPSERLWIRAGTGTYIYARHAVEPARILDDLQLHLWIAANRRGLQVYGQIVLPDTLDPATGRRATVLVAGESYETVGRWQRLRLTDVPLKLERQVRVLRARLRQPVDTRRAYLEAVVVNVYGGPGTTEVDFGQLETTGNIPPEHAAIADVAPAGYEVPNAAAWTAPQQRSGRLLVAGRPFFPRVIEFQGEPFALLRELGFNTIYLREPPTANQQNQARELGLWLIAPPPTSQLPPDDGQPILAWFVGEDFAATWADQPPERLDRLRRRDPTRRPLIAAVERDRWQASRALDILLHCREPLGSSFELSHFGPWLDQLNQLTRPGTPFWSCVQTSVAPGVVSQVEALTGLEAPLPATLQAEQIRQLALASVAAGARGLWFRSSSPLDAADPETQWRRWVIEWVNAELALIEPWAMGGRRIGEIPGTNAELRVVALATARSRLLIPTHVQASAQFACRPPANGNAMVIAGVSDSTDAFQLTHIGVTPLKKVRISGGLRIEVPAEAADALLLLTEDPLVVSHINRVVGQTKQRVVQLEQLLAERRLAEVEASAARALLATDERVDAWETARQALQTSRDLSSGNDSSAAYRFADQANRELDRLEADLWREVTGGKSSPLSHPAGAALPLALLANLPQPTSFETAEVARNLLRGGACEDLSLMIAAGWRQQQDAPADIETYLALSPQQPHSGRFSLRMLAAARTPDADQSVVERAPVWINTAPVTVQPGERIYLTGWLRIDRPIRGSYDGCVISDSIGGSDLALRFRRTDGWEPFQMVRAATRHDHLTVTIGLHGLGEVWVDDLAVTVEPSGGQVVPQVSQRR
jgi:hypothetical protein